MEIQAMLEWVNALCEEAREAANTGDVSKANALAKSPAMRDYWTNVFMLQSITGDDFVQWYPGKVKELNGLFEAYQQQTAQTEAVQVQADRLTSLEQKFETMMTRLESFMEAQTDSDPEPEPEQPTKRRASKKQDAAESDEEDQTDPADDAEADAESDE